MRTVGLRAGHASEGLEAQRHVGDALDRVVDVLGDFEVAFAAFGTRVVELVGKPFHLEHVGDGVGCASKGFPHAVVFTAVDLVGHERRCALDQVRFLELEAFAKLPPFEIGSGFVERSTIGRLDLFLPHQVGEPRRDRLGDDLGPFGLKKPKHIEVAVALGGVGPELAGDLDDRFGLQAIELDLVHVERDFSQWRRVLDRGQLVEKLDQDICGVELRFVVLGDQLTSFALDLGKLALLDCIAEKLQGLLENVVDLARRGFVGAKLVGELVEEVTHVDAVDQPQEEVGVELEPGFDVTLFEATLLLEEQHAKAIESSVTER